MNYSTQMKAFALGLAVMAAAPFSRADGVAAAVPDFAQYTKSARKIVKLDESTYNPFKVQNQQPTSPGRSLTALNNDEVEKLVSERGIQGVVFAKDGVSGTRIIIGDTVFAVGDELAFADAESITRLSASGVVRVAKITKESIQLEVSVTGQPSRLMSYSLAAFNNRR